MLFKHTFDDESMAASVAAGCHRCLDVLGMVIEGKPVKWEDNSAFLRIAYIEAFKS